MKVLFFSDVHGAPESVELLEKRIAEFEPSVLALLGDVLYHGPRNPLRPDYEPPEVVRRLNRLADRIVAVRGNCDCEVDQMLLEFPLMSDYSTLLVDGVYFFLTHGHRWNETHLPPLPSGAVLAHGHTHIPELKRLDSGTVIFNPGSLSLPKRGLPASYGTFEDGLLRIIELESGREMSALNL